MRLLLIILSTLLATTAFHANSVAQPWPLLTRSDTFDLIPWSPLTVPIVETPFEATPPVPPIAPHQRATLTGDSAALVAGNNKFGLDIYHQLAAAKPSDNVLVSPFSISAALAMTYAGARGRTAQQMADVLNFTLPDDRLHSTFGSLLRDLTANRDGYQLSIANRLFGQAQYPFNPAFLDSVGSNYDAPLEPTNFIGDPEGSRQRINGWVEDQTHHKIKNLMPDGSVTSDMVLVLTNAMYFKGSWKNKFDADSTHDDTFFTAGVQAKSVPMMRQQHSFMYSERPGFQMLEMPYAGDDLSMVVMLPTERNGLADVEASLTPQVLDDSLASLYPTTVNVSFPKFTFDSTFKLRTPNKTLR